MWIVNQALQPCDPVLWFQSMHIRIITGSGRFPKGKFIDQWFMRYSFSPQQSYLLASICKREQEKNWNCNSPPRLFWAFIYLFAQVTRSTLCFWWKHLKKLFLHHFWKLNYLETNKRTGIPFIAPGKKRKKFPPWIRGRHDGGSGMWVGPWKINSNYQLEKGKGLAPQGEGTTCAKA